jgi:hypothetical protein
MIDAFTETAGMVCGGLRLKGGRAALQPTGDILLQICCRWRGM